MFMTSQGVYDVTGVLVMSRDIRHVTYDVVGCVTSQGCRWRHGAYDTTGDNDDVTGGAHDVTGLMTSRGVYDVTG